MFTNWKDASYNLILVIIGWLTNMILQAVQITIDVPGLAKFFIDLVA